MRKGNTPLIKGGRGDRTLSRKAGGIDTPLIKEGRGIAE